MAGPATLGISPPPRPAPLVSTAPPRDHDAPTEPGPGLGLSTGPRSNAAAALRYRVLKPLARGGLGEVLLARDEEIGRIVALKRMQPQHADRDDLAARFWREAEITGHLEHPGIVPIYGLGHLGDGRPYYAMRFIQGQTLQEAIVQLHQSRDDWNSNLCGLLRRFVATCEAVAYAHSRGVVHRDIKPSNVMLGPFGETLLVDWGLAKATGVAEPDAGAVLLRSSAEANPGEVDPDATEPGQVLGTPGYMSPEQMTGDTEALGPPSDVYSLGVTLAVLLSGRAPASLHPIAPVPGRAPKPLWAIADRARAERPEDRYPDARALALDVERWLADEPVQAYRAPIPVRVARRLRRHRVSATIAAVVLLALGVILAARFQADQARALAETRFEQTMHAMQDYYLGVAEEVLLGHPELRDLRERLLQKPRQFYRDLAATLDGEAHPSPRQRRLLAIAHIDMGRIELVLNDLEGARGHFRAGLPVFERLAREDPGFAPYFGGISDCHTELGRIAQRLGAPDQAIESHRQATTAARAALELEPDRPQYHNLVARSLTNWGEACRQAGDLDRAVAAGLDSVDQLERALGRFPDYQLKATAATAHQRLALALLESGAVARAEAHADRAVALIEEALRSAPDPFAERKPSLAHTASYFLDYRSTLGMARLVQGQARAALLRDQAEVMASLRAAVAEFESVHERAPNGPDHARQLALALLELADAVPIAARPELWNRAESALAAAGPDDLGTPLFRDAALRIEQRVAAGAGDAAALRAVAERRRKLAKDCPAIPAFRRADVAALLDLADVGWPENPFAF